MPEDNENAFGERTGAADLADSAADRSVVRTMKDATPDQIAEQLRIARRNRNWLNWILLWVTVLGFAGAIAAVVVFEPKKPGQVVGGFMGVAFLVGMLAAILFQRREAKCPSCGYSWTIDERSRSNTLTWHNCPGCGLDMAVGSGETGTHNKAMQVDARTSRTDGPVSRQKRQRRNPQPEPTAK
jgi:ribosomal protein L37AE/L43A